MICGQSVPLAAPPVKQRVPHARCDQQPVRGHVEVLAVGPLAQAGGHLLALLGEEQRSAASGARVDC
jgi:hypothetical protein